MIRALPNILESLECVISALNSAKVRYLIAGGLAVNAHGYTRATHDILNPMLGGCAAGAILASKGGKGKDRLYAMGLGCAGFAAFSLVIDRLFDPTL